MRQCVPPVPHAFYQVNHAQTERLYACALDFAALTGKETVIDLYCGAGTITLALAGKAARVIGVEIVPEAIVTRAKTQNETIFKTWNSSVPTPDRPQ